VARYFISFRFDGRNYHGWQSQHNAVSVQETLNNCLSIVFAQSVYAIGCGRTDTGVHARYFVAHFDLKEEIIDIKTHQFKLESILPPDIGLLQLHQVTPEAHARFDATSRSYEYVIMKQNNPFIRHQAFYVYGKLNLEAMREAASYIPGERDYSCFSKSNTQVKTNICKVTALDIIEEHELIIIRISADRFLRNMVRAITGTLLEIAHGKRQAIDMQLLIESKDRRKAGFSAPAHGLFLTDVQYPENIFLNLNLFSSGKEGSA
jgi:tRNA pseudouridine38-40 synthase